MQFYTSRRLARSYGLEGDDATGTDNSGWLYSSTGAHLLKTTTADRSKSESSAVRVRWPKGMVIQLYNLLGLGRTVSVGEPRTLLAAVRSRTIGLAGYTVLQLVAGCSAPAIRFQIAYLAGRGAASQG